MAENQTKAAAGTATPPKPEGLTDARKTQLAQHYAASPDKSKEALVAHFREYASPEERAFIEQLANPRG